MVSRVHSVSVPDSSEFSMELIKQGAEAAAWPLMGQLEWGEGRFHGGLAGWTTLIMASKTGPRRRAPSPAVLEAAVSSLPSPASRLQPCGGATAAQRRRLRRDRSRDPGSKRRRRAERRLARLSRAGRAAARSLPVRA